MITYEDCVSLRGLAPEEVSAIAEYAFPRPDADLPLIEVCIWPFRAGEK